MKRNNLGKRNNVYRDLGCSQEDHLPNCSHFGFTGGYLSDHADWCEGGYTKPCICNPEARAKRAATAATEAAKEGTPAPVEPTEMSEVARREVEEMTNIYCTTPGRHDAGMAAVRTFLLNRWGLTQVPEITHPTLEYYRERRKELQFELDFINAAVGDQLDSSEGK